MSGKLRLEVLESGRTRGFVELPARGHFVIGRHEGADVVLGGAGVSRRHALLGIQGDEAWLLDLGSRNGTYVNGKQIEAETVIRPGDTLRIGTGAVVRLVAATEPVEAVLLKLSPPPVPKKYRLPRGGDDEKTAPAGFCEVCDVTLAREVLAGRSGAIRLDDGAIVCPGCAPKVRDRDLVARRYRVIGKLGEGGVATVSKAIDEEVRRVVAVKMMKTKGPSVAAAYLEREVEILRALDHPGIVRLLDVGEHHGMRFIVMDLVRGADLLSIVDARARLSSADAAVIGVAVASALSLAHRRGVVHRDVKPSNVLVDRSGVAKLTDFGVARWSKPQKRGASERMTVRGSRRGTPAYMSPEQAIDPASVGPQADVYGLGATLYHALTGEPPYGAGTPAVQILEKLDRREPPPEFPGTISATNIGLTTAVRRAMDPDPEKRFADGEAFRTALLEVLEGAGGLRSLVDPTEEIKKER